MPKCFGGDESHRRRQGIVAVILDDMVDTGGSLARAAYALVEKGAKKGLRVLHPSCLVGTGDRDPSEAPIEEMIVTDTIPLSEEAGII